MAYDVVIIGAGPAGLTAGIYASRGKLNTMLIEGPLPGGQLMSTTAVENWPGNISIMGPELMINMREQAQKCGCNIMSASVTKVDFTKTPYTLYLDNGQEVHAAAVIVATGASHKKLGCPGEKEYFAKGVSVCATCDAPFFADKEVVIVGGGDSAMTEAEHLTHFVKKLTVVHILDKLTGKDPIKDKVLANTKVEVLYSSALKEIKGDEQKVTSIVIENQLNKSLKIIPADGVFVAIGLAPNTSIFKGQLDIDNYGYLVVTDHTKTSVEGIFAAGDVADYRYRQAVTSAGTGCMAALDCQAYLNKK
ncbi:MAG: Tthioredoxin reductase [candidate division TM6 bacterium GW2011_GWF2_37_49]|nr:MAG: Tthioredoxin reductase [candidate division TM6 bacterium GW2011_GWF2_37_49]